MPISPIFTVFTPTYNRAATLAGVYSSLQVQTFRNFEWLIVDDGSADGTAALVQEWQAVAEFPIRYFWQPNGGKHRAFNRGVQEARGALFLTLDSDDSCVPEALERLKFYWDALSLGSQEIFSAVTALCSDSKGNVIGNRFPVDIFDSDTIACLDRYGIYGDKWGFQRTDVLRKFPFPEIAGEKYIAESLIWNRIARCYRTRYVNEVLKTVEYRKDGLSALSVKLRAENPLGSRLYYKEFLLYATSRQAKFKAAINYVRFSLHGKLGITRIFAEAATLWWVLIAMGPGLLVYSRDRYRLKNHN